jgi:hypothetical protein
MYKGLLTALILVSIYANTVSGQEFENTVQGFTTIIKAVKQENGYVTVGQGTGFFFHEYIDSNKLHFDYPINPVDSNLKNIWLITNKHVLFGEHFSATRINYPEFIEFYVRRSNSRNLHPIWDTFRIMKNELKQIVRLHTDSSIDVIAINITNPLCKLLSKANSPYLYSAISRMNFPSAEIVKAEGAFGLYAGTEMLAIGYPEEFYDRYNLFPTVKSGIIASKWGTKYNGNPYFLIDCKLFPGSSGSIIISKQLTFSGKTKVFDFFVFLGIYSGEFSMQKEVVDFDEMTITKKVSFNTGIVWYYYLIEEIINNKKESI